MNSTKKIITIDIGNSFIKIKCYDDICFIHADEFTVNNIKKYFDTIKNIDAVVISSIDTEMECQVVNFLADNNMTVYLADSLLRKQNIIDFSNIQGMGNDRKIGLIGALNFFESPIITIDCGTAITINILSENNICLGGAIMCGAGTQARALEYYTFSLPKIKINFKSYNDIDNTESAINAGIISTIRGGIVDFITNVIYKRDLQNVNIILTGGYSSQIFKLCRNRFNKISVSPKIKSVELKSHLVLYGLEKLIEEIK
jgi:type III pantothenate kinase